MCMHSMIFQERFKLTRMRNVKGFLTSLCWLDSLGALLSPRIWASGKLSRIWVCGRLSRIWASGKLSHIWVCGRLSSIILGKRQVFSHLSKRQAPPHLNERQAANFGTLFMYAAMLTLNHECSRYYVPEYPWCLVALVSSSFARDAVRTCTCPPRSAQENHCPTSVCRSPC